MARYSGWRKGVAITFIIVSLLTLVVSLERLVFDVFGQMWGTMLINGMTVLCTIAGMMGVCAGEKAAIGVYTCWSIISIGLNFVVVLIYNDVGLLSQKEHYLGLVIGNDNWWRTHGINCKSSSPNILSPANTTTIMTVTQTEGGSGAETTIEEDGCVLSYAIIETIHAVIYMLLTVLSVILGLVLLCSCEKKPLIRNEEEEEFSYVNIAQWHDYRTPRRHYNHRRHGKHLAPHKITTVQAV